MYSDAALNIYNHISQVKEFLQTREDSWTKSFLLEACVNQRMLSELRILALFSFAIGQPFTAYHNILVVKDCEETLRVTQQLLQSLCKISSPVRNDLELLWNFFECLPSLLLYRKDHCQRLREQKEKMKIKLKQVLLDWNDTDIVLAQKVFLAGEKELTKIGEEYLNEKTREELEKGAGNLSATNTDCERSLAGVKCGDTRAKHQSIRTIEAKRLYRNYFILHKDTSIDPTELSQTDQCEIRRIAREQPAARIRESEIVEVMQAKQEEKMKKIQEKKERKEEYKKKEKERLSQVELPNLD